MLRVGGGGGEGKAATCHLTILPSLQMPMVILRERSTPSPNIYSVTQTERNIQMWSRRGKKAVQHFQI